MTDRDRLTEMIKQANTLYLDYLESIDQKGLIDTEGRAEYIADHLIANGVIVPPVDIGKTVYKVSRLGKIVSLNVANYDYGVITFPYNIIPFENFGKTVFLTREEAEKVLERSKDNE